jgi:hypothetical protein
MNKRGIVYILFWFVSQLSGAQTFASRQLEYLYGLMDGCKIPSSSGSFKCAKLPGTLSLRVEYDKAGAISHLGIALFSEEVRAAVSKPVCDFQERLFLETLLQPGDAKAKALLNEYKVVIQDNDLYKTSFLESLARMLDFAKEATEYVLVKDSLNWFCSWNNENRGYSFHFPANYDLISGKDKKESEEELYETLAHYRCEEKPVNALVVNADRLSEGRNRIYIRQGEQSFIPSMNANLYLRKKETGDMALVYDRNFPEETVSNLFIHPDAKCDGLQMSVRQRMYGSQEKQYQMSLPDFFCYMKDDFEPFVGIEKCTPQELRFTVIYRSKYYNYYHLLSVQTSPETLFDKKEPLQAVFYSYIPNQNINNLYKEYTGNRHITIDLK